MIILGINAFHGDSSACILVDGVIIAASEEERFRRIKHWAGLPTESVKYCLNAAGITLSQVDHIAISRDPKAKLRKKALRAMKNPKLLLSASQRIKNSEHVQGVKTLLSNEFNNNELVKAKLHNIEHHRCHLASSFLASPYNEAALLSVDGMGDFTSTMTAIGKENQIKVLDSISYPHSLGYLYTAFTQFLGFPNFGDEYKLMGLSSYGNPIYTDDVWKAINLEADGKFRLTKEFYRHFSEIVPMTWDGGYPTVGNIWTKKFEEIYGPSRRKDEKLESQHMDLAASVQKVAEEVIYHLAEDLYKKTKLPFLCLSGGVAQNSVANGKLVDNTSFEKLYVPPAAHDAGTCVGAALYLQHQVMERPRNGYSFYAYTGEDYSQESIKQCLEKSEVSYQVLKDSELYHQVTECLMNSGVVGWFQGKAEFGPRALGNRSILVDPRRTDAKELLNQKIKRRESFRPFAPSILKEKAPDFFERVDDVPYMEKVFKIKKEARELIPAVTHVDGTGRLQTVDKQYNPKYYNLIEAFRQKTNIPVLLNTSFNENEPIVNSPKEALACFLRTKMDMLVLGDIVIRRSNI